MSQRPSLGNLQQDLRSSASVRSASQLVGLLVKSFTTSEIQNVLHQCIPVSYMVDWFQSSRVRFDFSSLLLNVSECLRVATTEQEEHFSEVVVEGVLHALRHVVYDTCPSVVVAALVHYSVIDSVFIAALAPLVGQKFVGGKTVFYGKRVTISVLTLGAADLRFHGLPEQVRDNFRRYLENHPSSSWGAYIGGPIYALWLQQRAAHEAALELFLAAEQHRAFAPAPSQLAAPACLRAAEKRKRADEANNDNYDNDTDDEALGSDTTVKIENCRRAAEKRKRADEAINDNYENDTDDEALGSDTTVKIEN